MVFETYSLLASMRKTLRTLNKHTIGGGREAKQETGSCNME